MSIKQYLIFGERGKLVREMYQMGMLTLNPKLIECDFPTDNVDFSEMGARDKDEMFSQLEEAYRKWGRFGHYGDIIQITVEANTSYLTISYIVNSIGRLAFPKGVVAIDLLLFVEDGSGKLFFLGTKRPKKSKYAGRPALIGGHVDMEDKHFESTDQAICHEGEEEVKVIISPINSAIAGEVPIPFAVHVDFGLGDIKATAVMSLMSTIRPEEGEENKDMPFNRVDWAIAYFMTVKTEIKLDHGKLLDWMQGGEDEPLVTMPLIDETPDFCYAHHRNLYDKALRYIKNGIEIRHF